MYFETLLWKAKSQNLPKPNEQHNPFGSLFFLWSPNTPFSFFQHFSPQRKGEKCRSRVLCGHRWQQHLRLNNIICLIVFFLLFGALIIYTLDAWILIVKIQLWSYGTVSIIIMFPWLPPCRFFFHLNWRKVIKSKIPLAMDV